MAWAGLDKNVVAEKAAQSANKMGIDQIQLKTPAESLSAQLPPLYNRIRGLDDLRHELTTYGWKQVEKRMLEAALGADGYVTWEAVYRAFYQYATENPGVFSAMFWYNKYQDKETQGVTEKLFSICFTITSSPNVSEKNYNCLIRISRAFSEDFCLLVNNNALSYSLSVEESFDLPLKVMIGDMRELEGRQVIQML